jgi:hypothetical protein
MRASERTGTVAYSVPVIVARHLYEVEMRTVESEGERAMNDETTDGLLRGATVGRLIPL